MSARDYNYNRSAGGAFFVLQGGAFSGPDDDYLVEMTTEFQGLHGLTVDGMFGPNTQAKAEELVVEEAGVLMSGWGRFWAENLWLPGVAENGTPIRVQPHNDDDGGGGGDDDGDPDYDPAPNPYVEPEKKKSSSMGLILGGLAALGVAFALKKKGR